MTGDQIWCVNKGPIGYLTNGVAIYSALTKPGHDAVHYEDFDDCQGHTSPTGVYHYHKFSCKIINFINYCVSNGKRVDLNSTGGHIHFGHTTIVISKLNRTQLVLVHVSIVFFYNNFLDIFLWS